MSLLDTVMLAAFGLYVIWVAYQYRVWRLYRLYRLVPLAFAFVSGLIWMACVRRGSSYTIPTEDGRERHTVFVSPTLSLYREVVRLPPKGGQDDG